MNKTVLRVQPITLKINSKVEKLRPYSDFEGLTGLCFIDYYCKGSGHFCVFELHGEHLWAGRVAPYDIQNLYAASYQKGFYHPQEEKNLIQYLIKLNKSFSDGILLNGRMMYMSSYDREIFLKNWTKKTDSKTDAIISHMKHKLSILPEAINKGDTSEILADLLFDIQLIKCEVVLNKKEV
jgi:hypothetical protein